MTWIIAGGSGQLGTALDQELTRLRQEHHSLSSKQLDISDAQQVDGISLLNPSVIVNCAAWTDVEGAESHPEECRKLNISGALNLADLARRLQIPFIQISTDYVFSGYRERPWEAMDITNPTSIYGASKAEAERLILNLYPEGSCIIRTAWLYSPWRKNFAKTILKRAAQKLPSKVVNDQYGQPTSARDLAGKICELFQEQPRVGIFHGTNSGVATWFEFAQEIYRLAGADTWLVDPVSSEEFPTKVVRPTYSVLSHQMWHGVGLREMQDWRIALTSVFPEILDEVSRELANA